MLNRVLQWRNAHKKKPHIFVASGIRHDLALQSRDYIRLLAKHFVGGHLKIAPEHICPHVLDMMQKPHNETFEAFEREFDDASKRGG